MKTSVTIVYATSGTEFLLALRSRNENRKTQLDDIAIIICIDYHSFFTFALDSLPATTIRHTKM